MTIILREDQQILKNGIYEDWQHGARNALGVLSTGGGKSVIMSDITLDVARMEKQQAVIAHRNELVSQMSMHVANRGIPHRIIGSAKTISMITQKHRKAYGRSFVNPSALTAVVGVDTLIKRRKDLEGWARQMYLWKIDEAHHVLRSNKWGQAVEMMPNAIGLGMTATAIRADGKGLGRDYDGVFDSIRVGMDMRSLIKIGALSDFEIACPTSDLIVDEKDVSAGGDWSNNKLRQAVKKSRIVGDTVKNYCKFAWGRQAIVFATDVETAGETAAKFNDAGIRAAALSAETNPDVRDKYVEEFKSGKLKVLVNVDLFDEGFDVPACDVVIMARPTASLGKYRQMVGRALRFVPGKVALIIDQVSNIVRHGLPDKFVEWSLARREKRGAQEKDPDEIPLTVCKNPACFKPYEKFRPFCPYCGMSPPLPEPRERSIEMVDGDLILIDRAKLEEMRRATQCETPADIGARVGFVAGEYAGQRAIKNQIEKIESQRRLSHAIAQWAAVERERGFPDSEIYRRFYLTTGVDVLTAMKGDRTGQEFDDLATRVESWYLS